MATSCFSSDCTSPGWLDRMLSPGEPESCPPPFLHSLPPSALLFPLPSCSFTSFLVLFFSIFSLFFFFSFAYFGPSFLFSHSISLFLFFPPFLLVLTSLYSFCFAAVSSRSPVQSFQSAAFNVIIRCENRATMAEGGLGWWISELGASVCHTGLR